VNPAEYRPSPLAAAGPAAPRPWSRAARHRPPARSLRTELPAPVVFQRGDYSFNRRFFETKLLDFSGCAERGG